MKASLVSFLGTSDFELLQRLKDGEKEACSELFRRYQKPIYEFLCQMSGNPASSQDLVQEVFLRVFLNAHSFQGNSKVSTWLFAIAKNCCLSFLRKQRVISKRTYEQTTEEKGQIWDHLESPARSPYQETEDRIMFCHLTKALSDLTKEQQEVFLLREGFEFSHKEISMKIGCPENTVKTRSFRAIGHLKKALLMNKKAA